MTKPTYESLTSALVDYLANPYKVLTTFVGVLITAIGVVVWIALVMG